MPSTAAIRPLTQGDEAAWRRLWTDYLTFYKATRPEEVYATTFARLVDPSDPGTFGFIAEVEGKPVGLVNCVIHRHLWRVEDVCYLGDLYVDPDIRGTGAGRALIEAVYDHAGALGAPHVYWMTQEFNAEARKLYDRIGELTPFIKYQRRAA